MTTEQTPQKLIIVNEDPSQKLWQENIKNWAVDRSITHEKLMETYPRYTIEDKTRYMLHKLLPNLF
ncbi:hypothetical protein A2130_02780 [Candidatus Woesebacteria bacterium GWC2_33_12]|uniref:Uncharacterized protein n=1 Tax=Candidatus Woesebacteria bacterium GW2011_GWB1_33_22 TaxID=1618566 RepID=A0A0G0CLA6_9BACT|nr:MAG: hypothetical protein UR29_C0013G0056 [Candidatus Woesebacteria bacterium GW2011_GWC2_33_12]KKP41743.1 MAG: hypothetical protein UR33_C0011G0058 [Candidatus Woesebacteria bacterium GW2011_GWA2_33_20]KKP44122.1 MAG: hypothetical protein UR35_C0011G0008 [Candidatus Woesebacteria bacterium GW2011_GWB1_33_22]KKP45781.1 MAG: hypothetical protein UR37_C0014G0008 [Microgenomates group bacterium GW2011_GWC1_33_28]KKP50204.1 MAG: hypothetical protein UR41_C0010G0008 [Candidatus Woesebacteria bact